MDPATTQPQWKPAYQVWPGNVIFCCRGRCITAYPSGPAVCAWSFILVPCGIYTIFAERLWQEWFPVVPIAAALMFFVTTMSLCCLTWAPSALANASVQLAAVAEGLRQVGYKWCRTCQIVRPPRSSHCPDCDHCVMRYDHHCPFVNNCIGQRNYIFFVGFVSSVVCLAIVVLPGMEPNSDVVNTALMIAVISVASLAGLAFLSLIVFLGYHTFLIASGMTTKEHLGKSGRAAQIDEEPTLCAARGPRLFNPRALIQVEHELP
ncbi:putative palmitoyltransferase ZDHHC14 [Symbiodinium microadriaticum]|uniref:Palmitoyltransferase n=1 Tax=Symbiodinium microadriaticum TaxID=2951 RepID=A0A1Q9EUQ0_SYMMI|nr:putative palmitoyltransferase ZDHHC14 [Symbiodinium microadriaticum]